MQGWRNGFESWGAMESFIVGLMVDWQGKFFHSRHSRMSKTVTSWLWWQPFNIFCFETLSFFLCFPFFILLRKKVERWGGIMTTLIWEFHFGTLVFALHFGIGIVEIKFKIWTYFKSLVSNNTRRWRLKRTSG